MFVARDACAAPSPPSAPLEPEQIMRGTEQRPFAFTGLVATAHEAITTTGALDLFEYRLNRLAALL